MSDNDLDDLFTDLVSNVDPSHRLSEIRQASAAKRRQRSYAVGGAALACAAAVVVTAVLVVRPGDSGRVNEPTPAPPSYVEPTTGEPTPIYFLGETPQGPRLFAEPHLVEDARAAVLQPLQADPDDPDYRTLWPEGSLRPATGYFAQSGGVKAEYVEVTQSELADRPDGMSEDEAALALQQLAYSLTSRETPVVEFFDSDHQPMTSLLGIDVTQGLTRAIDTDVLALANIDSPREGDTVNGSLVANGTANSFESNVPWRIEDESGATVLDGFTTAEGGMGEFSAWQTDPIDVSKLSPGSYTFIASTGDATGGEGVGPTEDSRSIVIEEASPAPVNQTGVEDEPGARLMEASVQFLSGVAPYALTTWWQGSAGKGEIVSVYADGRIIDRKPFSQRAYDEAFPENPLPVTFPPALNNLSVRSLDSLAPQIQAIVGGSDGATEFPLEQITRSTDRGKTWTAFGNPAAQGQRAYLTNGVVLPDGRLLVLLHSWSDDLPGQPSIAHHGLWISEGDDWESLSPFTPEIEGFELNDAMGYTNIQDLQGDPSGALWLTTNDNRLFVSTGDPNEFSEIPVR